MTADDARAALEFAAHRTGEPIAPFSSGSDAMSGVVIRSVDSRSAEEEALQLGLDPTRRSPLGRRPLEPRAEGIASGEPLLAT